MLQVKLPVGNTTEKDKAIGYSKLNDSNGSQRFHFFDIFSQRATGSGRQNFSNFHVDGQTQ